MNPSQNRSIAKFVREALGCQCADDAFRSITIDDGRTTDGSIRFARIVVGDRLLVYVVPPTGENRGATLVPALAQLGRQERDNKGYNRFRLVITSEDADLFPPAADLFRDCAGQDDKAHLHIVLRKELPDMTTSA
jgi:hypothetical protein